VVQPRGRIWPPLLERRRTPANDRRNPKPDRPTPLSHPQTNAGSLARRIAPAASCRASLIADRGDLHEFNALILKPSKRNERRGCAAPESLSFVQTTYVADHLNSTAEIHLVTQRFRRQLVTWTDEKAVSPTTSIRVMVNIGNTSRTIRGIVVGSTDEPSKLVVMRTPRLACPIPPEQTPSNVVLYAFFRFQLL
jgi:hypothetical protein